VDLYVPRCRLRGNATLRADTSPLPLWRRSERLVCVTARDRLCHEAATVTARRSRTTPRPLPSTNDGVPMANSERNADKNSGSEPKLLSGGNPQIPKGEGDEPVQAYVAAMPGWKRSLGERLDGLIVLQFRPRRPSTTGCATSTSTKTTTSTRTSSRPGSNRRASCPARRCRAAANALEVPAGFAGDACRGRERVADRDRPRRLPCATSSALESQWWVSREAGARRSS
jgi:hypothetical protein